MAITFPNSPSSGDTHTTSNGLQYTYDGEKWTTIGTNSAGTWTRSGTTVSLTTAGDDLNVDSGTLFVDASTNNVGVGTSSPASGLHLSGAATSNSRLTLTQTAAGLYSTVQQGPLVFSKPFLAPCFQVTSLGYMVLSCKGISSLVVELLM